MKTVILIDDSPIFLRILERILSSKYKVIGTANNGFDGIAMYQKLKPDFVLMDITMPNISGKECLTEIKKQDPHAKVLMVSSISDEETEKECLNLGAIGFVKKNIISVKNEGIPDQLQNAIDLVIAA